jgi:hypothetical protein
VGNSRSPLILSHPPRAAFAKSLLFSFGFCNLADFERISCIPDARQLRRRQRGGPAVGIRALGRGRRSMPSREACRHRTSIMWCQTPAALRSAGISFSFSARQDWRRPSPRSTLHRRAGLRPRRLPQAVQRGRALRFFAHTSVTNSGAIPALDGSWADSTPLELKATRG